MAGKRDWKNHPHWHLLVLVPLVVFLISEDDGVTRTFLAVGLFSGAVHYGRATARWSRPGTGRSVPDPRPVSADPGEYGGR
ncbi:hypothetical protein ACIGO8_16285 [Streptomyces sp. NPDC053493]|uniref:hypothetical protein n=1 Tax=Streptomyces sp. NPDC053493 TaxID=3365705 RepID=UPI0037D6A191